MRMIIICIVLQREAGPQRTRAAVRTKARTALPGTRYVSSADLLRGRTYLVIEHEGEEYRLRLTRKGKLILTK